MTIREIYNVILCRFGIRKILPCNYVNTRKVVECGELLVKYQDCRVRQRVAEMLAKANESLANTPYHIQVVSAYRTIEEQMDLWHKHSGGDKTKVADPRNGTGGGHQTGGAVDVILLKNGVAINMGSEVGEFNEKTRTYSPFLSENEKQLRMTLHSAMIEVGFINYPAEWWHFCYGDRMWAAYSQNKYAIYGQVNE